MMHRRLWKIFTLLLLSSSAIMFAENPSKEIITYAFDEGTVAFIKPQKMPPAANSPARKPLVYDITMNTLSDSVSVTCTVISVAEPIENCSATVCDSLTYAVERIYVEPEKKAWTHRLRFKMPVGDFSGTFARAGKLTIAFGPYSFELNGKKQKGRSEICRAAMQIIELNRQ